MCHLVSRRLFYATFKEMVDILKWKENKVIFFYDKMKSDVMFKESDIFF